MTLNPPYEGNIIAALPLEGRLPGKFYAAEILRPDHSREWAYSKLGYLDVKRRIEENFNDSDQSPIPQVIIAMPHVIRIYHPGNPRNGRETNFHSTLYETETLTERLVDHDPEVGCDAEIAILAAERKFWRDAQSVEEYLTKFAPLGSTGKVANTNKLREYLQK